MQGSVNNFEAIKLSLNVTCFQHTYLTLISGLRETPFTPLLKTDSLLT